MEDYVKKKEEEDKIKKERIELERLEKNISEFSKFGKLKIDVGRKLESGDSTRTIKKYKVHRLISEYFYPVLIFDRDSFEDNMYDFVDQSTSEKSFPKDFNTTISFSLGLVPEKDTLDKCKELIKEDFMNGFYWASWITFAINVSGDNINVSFKSIDDYDEPIVFRIADRRSAGTLRNLLMKIFNNEIKYPSGYSDIPDMHENLETYICNKSGLSSEYGLDMNHFVDALRKVNINSLFKEIG